MRHCKYEKVWVWSNRMFCRSIMSSTVSECLPVYKQNLLCCRKSWVFTTNVTDRSCLCLCTTLPWGMWGCLKLCLSVRHCVRFYILSSAVHLLRGWIKITILSSQTVSRMWFTGQKKLQKDKKRLSIWLESKQDMDFGFLWLEHEVYYISWAVALS